MIFQKAFTDQEITPYPNCNSNFSVISSVIGEIFLPKPRPILASGHIMKRFGPFVPGSP